jgi:phage tail tape-measure protein
MSNNNLRYELSLKDLFTNKMKSAIGQTEKLDSRMNRLGSSLKGLRNTVASIGLGAAIFSFGRGVIESLKNYEYFSASLRTLLHGDAGMAQALEMQLVSLAKRTPFTLTEVQDATKQLIAYGFAAGDVVSNITMLGDVASGLKIPFGDIAYLYGTLKTQGRAFTKDINQFTGRGIPIIKELAKQFKVADSEVMKLVEEGKVGFKEVEKAFKSMTKEGGMFFGMMEKQSQTVGGQLSMIEDNWEQLKVQVGKSQRGIIASTVSFVNDMIGAFNVYLTSSNKMESAFEKFGANQISYWQSFRDTLRQTLDFLGGFGLAATTQVRLMDAFLDKSVAKSATSLEEAIKVKAGLLGAAKLTEKKYLSGEINKDTFDKQMALIMGSMESVKNNISLFGAKEGAPTVIDSLSGSGAPTVIDSLSGSQKDIKEKSTEISGSKPTNFTININKLIETQNITSQMIGESMPKIKEMVSKALLEAVNDVNYIVR